MPFPSDEQQQVIEHRGSPMVVVAGPGTGKTATIIQRMVELLREDPGREVTFITFTRASRRDCERKLVRELGEQELSSTDLEFPRVSTLHRYAKHLVHKYGDEIGQSRTFSILIDVMGERDLIVQEALGDSGLTIPVEDAKALLIHRRATGDWPMVSSLSEGEKRELLENYRALLHMYQTLDMEEVILVASRILDSGSVLPALFLQIDEYQDLNAMDQRFLELLSAHPASEIIAVGDDAQSIYGSLRHAHPEGIQALWINEDWTNVRLSDSFRLKPHILNASLELISGNDYLGAGTSRKPPGDRRIPVLQCTKSDVQIEAIARDISGRMAASGQGNQGAISYKDFIVLCPTKDWSSKAATVLSEDFQIPTKSTQARTIPDELWPLILVLRVAIRSDPLALRQLLPKIGLSGDAIESIRQDVLQEGSSYYDHCISLEGYGLDEFSEYIDIVRGADGVKKALVQALTFFDWLPDKSVVSELVDQLSIEEGDPPTLSKILGRLYEGAGLIDAEEFISDEDAVLVITLHSAKGLEAEVVYCPWMSSDFMPMPGRDEEEQRRLLYVAMTRAKAELVVLFHEKFVRGQGLIGQEMLSPYLRGIPGYFEVHRVAVGPLRSGELSWIK